MKAKVDDIWGFCREILDCNAESKGQFSGCISLDVSMPVQEWIKICHKLLWEEIIWI